MTVESVLRQQQLATGRDFKLFSEISDSFGVKAAGLLVLPKEWCPPYIALSSNIHERWKNSGSIDYGASEAHIKEWIAEQPHSEADSIIVRSSGVTEKIGDRGRFHSKVCPPLCSIESVTKAIRDIFEHAREIEAEERIAILLQHYLIADSAGHLSNETRLSPTRNQWMYEVEKPTWTPPRGINSKFALIPNSASEFMCGLGIPHQALRSLGGWINGQINPRCHIEWLARKNRLWIVQLDIEWPQHDLGIDPHNQALHGRERTPDFTAASKLLKYVIGEPTDWNKLRNLNDFDFENRNEQPNIFEMPTSVVLNAGSDQQYRDALVDEVDRLTAGKVVVRTDCNQIGAPSFNLPRTDTVSAKVAVDWSIETLESLEDNGFNPANIVFLVHGFIPAAASAWVYAQPDNPITIVDALWGLPDGLQVLPHDTYQVNTIRGHVTPPNSRYKPRFLFENADGSWNYKDILRSKGRSKVLKQKDILEVAQRTSRISQKLGKDAQIMWFGGIPDSHGVGRNIPWYLARESIDHAPRVTTRYPPYEVRNLGDLRRLPDRKAMIRLSPDAELIRDDSFLQSVIDIALEKRLPVELHGSLLGHTYYRLSNAGVGVALAEAPKYYRSREKRSFGKLVRDNVPASIESGGEQVVEALLDKADAIHGLAGKLLEELEEFLRAGNVEEQSAELADILEVVRGLSFAADVDWKTVEANAEIKRSKRGGFEHRRVLLETSLPTPVKRPESAITVRLVDIAHISSNESKVEIPAALLLTSILGRALHAKTSDPAVDLKIVLRSGNVEIALKTRDIDVIDEHQLPLFPEI